MRIKNYFYLILEHNAKCPVGYVTDENKKNPYSLGPRNSVFCLFSDLKRMHVGRNLATMKRLSLKRWSILRQKNKRAVKNLSKSMKIVIIGLSLNFSACVVGHRYTHVFQSFSLTSQASFDLICLISLDTFFQILFKSQLAI